MKMTDALLGEHAVFYAIFDNLEKQIPGIESLDNLKSLAELLAAPLIGHAMLENEELFTALDPQLGGQGPLEVMRGEHGEIEGTLQDAANATDLKDLKQQLLRILQVARNHFGKEENVLFPMALSHLGEGKLTALGNTWAEKRKVTLA